jgi:hypothetical protein
MKIPPALAVACVLLLPGALSAESFEGKLTMKIQDSSSGQPPLLNMSLKPGFMRVDMTSPRGGPVAMITDFSNRQMMILMFQQQMYMVQPFGQAPNAQGGGPSQAGPGGSQGQGSLVDTGETETILGYVCKKYTANGNGSTAQIWVTDQLGMFAGFSPPGGPMGRSAAPSPWESALKGRNFFPMRVIGTKANGQTFRMEVVSVDKQSLPDSDFQPPEGFRKFDLGGMGGMPFGMPGARPPSGNY